MDEKPSRYKNKRRTPISFGEFEGLIAHVEAIPDTFRIDHLARSSLVTILFYTGLRLGEVVGDSDRKWKALTTRGLQLSRSLEGLPENYMDTPEMGLWYWKHRGALPGIRREDMKPEGSILYLSSDPLKHGVREDPLELSLKWPYVELVKGQWDRALEGGKVWNISQASARRIVGQAAELLYPHAFRASLATSMARDPAISVSDLLTWFGWARSATADAYIMRARGMATTRASIDKIIKQA